MLKKILILATVFLFLSFNSASFLLASPPAKTMGGDGKVAIILASFGTTVPSAVKSITNIHEKVREAFPDVPVKITFTSNMIRSVWKKDKPRRKNG